MSLLDEIAADLDEIFADTGRLVGYAGGMFPALVSELSIEDELDTGGFVRSAGLVVKIRRSALGETLPKTGETVKVDNESFRIEKVSHRQGHPLVALDLGPIHR